MRKLSEYKTIVFDCDGVILDSNPVKTSAFYYAVFPYGENAASEMLRYHKDNGGVSRYQKISHFLAHIAPVDVDGPGYEELLERYRLAVVDGLRSCQQAPGLSRLRSWTDGSGWAVVSGSDQEELRAVFRDRAIDKYFDRGIFGSPDTKSEILERELAEEGIRLPALFLGDSRYDYEAARGAGLDFVFVDGWTEMSHVDEWCRAVGCRRVHGLDELLIR